VECGLIESYARPGTNVTGVAWFQSIEVHGKLAEFVREIVPSARRLAWMVFPADLITVSGGEFSPKLYYAKVAKSLGFQFSYYECRKPEDIEPAFAALRLWGAQAVIVEPAALSFLEARRIADLARAGGLPTFCGQTQNVLGGGLLGYSPIHIELQVQAMGYVDRVFRGARPAEMPVEMPNKLELSINIGSAKALGLTIPPSVLLSADRVVE
jgi:putative ABC transport system substrate-binding protein